MSKHRFPFGRGSAAIVVATALVLVGPAAPAFAGGPPSISGFSPATGSPGTLVTVSGTNLTGVSSVDFNGVATSFTFVDDGHVVASVPAGASTGKISITTTGGSAQSAANFVVTAPPPNITNFSPSTGLSGTSVTINGTNFVGVNSVSFNGVPAAFTLVNATRVTATVPSGATTGRITVSTTSGTAQSGSNFTVAAAAAPTISSISPTSGSIGASVVIKGSGFSGATFVGFNGVSATFKVNKGSKITATVPAGATSGPVSVSTPSGTATFSGFTVVAAGVPTITSLSPASGQVGAAVKIRGTNFGGATSVKFNGMAAVFTVDNSTTISTHVPAGATTGPIVVLTPSGTASSVAFTVIGSGPVINRLSPESGKVGTEVTIRGSKFTGATSVKFNGVAAVFTINGDGRIKATVPTKAKTGRVTVTTPAGTGTSTTTFTVIVVAHARQVTFHLSGRLNATGRVSVSDNYDACASQLPVIIQRFRGGEWRWVATTATRKDGSYRIYIRNLRGRYRAVAKKIALTNGNTCSKDLSRTLLHHR